VINIQISHAPRPQCVVIPFRPDVLKLIPHAKAFAVDGRDLIAIPHGIEETRLLRNLDLRVPAPIAEHYDYPGPQRPFLVQKLTTAMMTMQPRMFVLNDMGTGKTRCAIWSYDFLKKRGLAKKMLVICPISTMRFVWEREIKIIAPYLKVAVLHGLKEKRLDTLAGEWDIAIINHDGLAVMFDALFKTNFDVVVLDEAAMPAGVENATRRTLFPASTNTRMSVTPSVFAAVGGGTRRKARVACPEIVAVCLVGRAFQWARAAVVTRAVGS